MSQQTESHGSTIHQITLDGLDLLQKTLQKPSSEEQQFLDLGCGIGDVTREALLPRCLPVGRIVAADVSKDKIETAKKHFAHPKICYDVLDALADDVSAFVKKYGQFDRVYAIFLFNWVKDQEKGFMNVFDLLKPGGECLCMFYASSFHLQFRKKLANTERWKKYAQICESTTPGTIDLVGNEARISYMRRLLKSANLTPTFCDVIQEISTRYGTKEDLIRELMEINPLTAKISKEEMPFLREEVMKKADRLWAEKEAGGSPLDYPVYIVRASKVLS
ncbi:juvenile hormone acid O-methyltransferase-like [Ixodes scapularis]|uniref:juvenile hormone acid O-methyltransferase-like n=1 Tax=Ixodes scapularis TaxID=6945 RepID=UPI001C391C41|nr:juvenile hormone acid O-methyltransferase-like [Ixodes scapularis]